MFFSMPNTVSFTKAEVNKLLLWLKDPIKTYRLVRLLSLTLQQEIKKEEKAKWEKTNSASIVKIRKMLKK